MQLLAKFLKKSVHRVQSDLKFKVKYKNIHYAGLTVGSISAALSCLVYPPREFGGGAQAPLPNSGW